MCLCGDSECPSCGPAQGTLEPKMSPLPWRVERGFAVARIVAADESVVAENLTITDAEAIVAALAVVEAARSYEGYGQKIDAAIAAYDEATNG